MLGVQLLPLHSVLKRIEPLKWLLSCWFPFTHPSGALSSICLESVFLMAPLLRVVLKGSQRTTEKNVKGQRNNPKCKPQRKDEANTMRFLLMFPSTAPLPIVSKQAIRRNPKPTRRVGNGLVKKGGPYKWADVWCSFTGVPNKNTKGPGSFKGGTSTAIRLRPNLRQEAEVWR